MRAGRPSLETAAPLRRARDVSEQSDGPVQAVLTEAVERLLPYRNDLCGTVGGDSIHLQHGETKAGSALLEDRGPFCVKELSPGPVDEIGPVVSACPLVQAYKHSPNLPNRLVAVSFGGLAKQGANVGP